MDENVKTQFQVSTMTAYMIEECIKAKQKLVKYEHYLARLMWVVIFMGLISVVTVFQLMNHHDPLSFIDRFSIFSVEGVILSCMILCFLLFHTVNEKVKKAKSDFDHIRTEIIARSGDLWVTGEEKENQHNLYQYLLHTHDINLYF